MLDVLARGCFDVVHWITSKQPLFNTTSIDSSALNFDLRCDITFNVLENVPERSVIPWLVVFIFFINYYQLQEVAMTAFANLITGGLPIFYCNKIKLIA